MLKNIRVRVIRRLTVKRKYPSKWKTDIAPRILKFLERNKVKAFTWDLEENSDVGYEVFKGEDKYVINIRNKTCNCRVWQLIGIPSTLYLCNMGYWGWSN